MNFNNKINLSYHEKKTTAISNFSEVQKININFFPSS